MESIETFTKHFGKIELPSVTHLRRNTFLLTKEQQEILVKLRDTTIHVAGTFLGSEEKYFRPSPALLEILREKGAHTYELDDKTSYLFLCGRDVLEAGNAPDGFLILIDKQGRILGYGKKMRDKFTGTTIIKNFWDKGDFLRREMSKRR